MRASTGRSTSSRAGINCGPRHRMRMSHLLPAPVVDYVAQYGLCKNKRPLCWARRHRGGKEKGIVVSPSTWGGVTCGLRSLSRNTVRPLCSLWVSSVLRLSLRCFTRTRIAGDHQPMEGERTDGPWARGHTLWDRCSVDRTSAV